MDHDLRGKSVTTVIIIFGIVSLFYGLKYPLVEGQMSIHPVRTPCLVCFYTAEDKPIELDLTPRRNGTSISALNFDFTKPINGNLTQTSRGLIYTPEKDFVGNDTFIIQVKNTSSSLGYSQIPVKMVVVSSDKVDKGIKPEMIPPYVAIVSALVATGGLIFTSMIFRRDDKTRQVQTATGIMNDLQNLEKDARELWEEIYDAKVDYKRLSEQQIPQNIRDELKVLIGRMKGEKEMNADDKMEELRKLNLKKEMLINTISDKLEWIAYLILEKRIKDDALVSFFDIYITKMCDDFICKSKKMREEIRDTKSPYTNLKKLYRTINNREICDAQSRDSDSNSIQR